MHSGSPSLRQKYYQAHTGNFQATTHCRNHCGEIGLSNGILELVESIGPVEEWPSPKGAVTTLVRNRRKKCLVFLSNPLLKPLIVTFNQLSNCIKFSTDMQYRVCQVLISLNQVQVPLRISDNQSNPSGRRSTIEKFATTCYNSDPHESTRSAVLATRNEFPKCGAFGHCLNRNPQQ